MEWKIEGKVGARNDITAGEFISTVVSSPLAAVPRWRKRRWRRDDVSHGHLRSEERRVGKECA